MSKYFVMRVRVVLAKFLHRSLITFNLFTVTVVQVLSDADCTDHDFVLGMHILFRAIVLLG